VLTFVIFSLRRAWQGFWRNIVMSLAATATMILMLLLLAGFFVLQSGLLRSLEFVEQKVEVVAYIQNNATQFQVDELIAQLRADPDVASVDFIDRAAALERFRQAQIAQGRQDLTQYLESNPLYASVEVKLTNAAKVGDVTRSLEAAPEVRQVLNIQALVDRVLTVTNVLRTAGVVILAVVGVIALFIIVNTIRLAVFARSEEIEIMRLVGASDAFIRWPFVFEGALVGLLGALVTLGVLYAVAEPVSSFMVGFFEIVPLSFQTLARDTAVLVLAVGVGIGTFGSWLSVRTYLIR